VQVRLGKGRQQSCPTTGREAQRVVAVARAGDEPGSGAGREPTGNLGTKSVNDVFELMRQVNRDSGTSVLLVTHNFDLARRCDRIIEVVDGRIQRQVRLLTFHTKNFQGISRG